jgi:crotonobetainyl-CoA:carnitine CoA-transferase CaiB-like acyl-CoA transferase
LKVLDFGNFLAGPLAPMLMADLGADVIKLETTTGDMMRHVERVFAGCQRGKRDIALDLKKPESREILERIVGWADVIHHNIRMPAAIKLGIDEPTLRKINPKMVYCHTSSYGPIGPRKDWPGYDQLFQSSCGWEYEGAGEGNPPMWHRFGMMDHQCAMASVVATLLGVMRRDETGEGQTVSASLLGAALLTTSETLVLPDGKLAPYPRLDNRQTGVSPTDRIYQLADGWIAVVARTTEQVDALCRVAGATTLEAVEAKFAGRECASTLSELEQAGVPCEPVRLDQTQEFLFGDATTSAGLVASYDHLAYGRMRQVGGLWDFGDLQLTLDTPPPILGQNSAAIMRELGFTEDHIRSLAESGAVVAADLA